MEPNSCLSYRLEFFLLISKWVCVGVNVCVLLGWWVFFVYVWMFATGC